MPHPLPDATPRSVKVATRFAALAQMQPAMNSIGGGASIAARRDVPQPAVQMQPSLSTQSTGSVVAAGSGPGTGPASGDASPRPPRNMAARALQDFARSCCVLGSCEVLTDLLNASASPPPSTEGAATPAAGSADELRRITERLVGLVDPKRREAAAPVRLNLPKRTPPLYTAALERTPTAAASVSRHSTTNDLGDTTDGDGSDTGLVLCTPPMPSKDASDTASESWPAFGGGDMQRARTADHAQRSPEVPKLHAAMHSADAGGGRAGSGDGGAGGDGGGSGAGVLRDSAGMPAWSNHSRSDMLVTSSTMAPVPGTARPQDGGLGGVASNEGSQVHEGLADVAALAMPGAHEEEPKKSPVTPASPASPQEEAEDWKRRAEVAEWCLSALLHSVVQASLQPASGAPAHGRGRQQQQHQSTGTFGSPGNLSINPSGSTPAAAAAGPGGIVHATSFHHGAPPMFMLSPSSRHGGMIPIAFPPPPQPQAQPLPRGGSMNHGGGGNVSPSRRRVSIAAEEPAEQREAAAAAAAALPSWQPAAAGARRGSVGSVIDDMRSVASFAAPPVRQTARGRLQQETVDGTFELNQLVMLYMVGSGAQGEVFAAFDQNAEEMRAVKAVRRPKPKQKKPASQSPDRVSSPPKRSDSDNSFGRGDSGVAAMTAKQKKAQMLEREVAIMKRCRHRNVVALYEVIDDPELDCMYLVMQYVEHGPLCKQLPDGTIQSCVEARRVAHYARQLCAGLQYLHTRGVIHRDIKPDNILLGQNDQVYLADFGVADLFESDPEEQKDELNASVCDTRGTFAFMAPELLNPDFDAADGKAADVWALGLSLYVLLYGKLPFELASRAATIRAVLAADFAFPDPEIRRRRSVAFADDVALVAAPELDSPTEGERRLEGEESGGQLRTSGTESSDVAGNELPALPATAQPSARGGSVPRHVHTERTSAAVAHRGVVSVLKRMLERDPAQRASAAECHRAFRDLDELLEEEELNAEANESSDAPFTALLSR